ncbi:class II aldolase/adducin family protein [candidate division GN15 bacterium]|nr:class II aldolase/adducin family protein [candidate division GN15 bacterium]
MSQIAQHIAAILETGRRLDKREMIAGSDGNISVRLDAQSILITPSGSHKGRLNSDDLVVINLSGSKISGCREASSEAAMHLAVYRQRPDVGACVHAHPPHATAFAVAGQALPEDVLPEVVVFCGEITLTNYAPPGTAAVPDTLVPHLPNHDCFLLGNHGLLTTGRTLEEAYNRHETVEQYAKILLLARQLGTVQRLPSEDLDRLRSLRQKLRERSDPSASEA